MNGLNKHLKAHVMFYLGLAQVVAGWLATVDVKNITYPAAALAVSGLVMLIAKYVQINLPDDPPVNPSQPALPAKRE